MSSSAEPRLLLLPRQRLAEAWSLMLPHLARFEPMAAGRDTLAAAHAAIAEGRWLAWLVVEGVALSAVLLTEVRPGWNGLVQHVVHWIGGRGLRRWFVLLPELEAATRALGCTCLTWRGRHGWVRALRPHGYRPTRTVMEKTLAPAAASPLTDGDPR